jgi:hypothetical protein
LPKLSNEPKNKAMDLTEQQVKNLVKNFKMNYKAKMYLKIEDLVPDFQDALRKTVEDIYMQIGLDLAINVVFTL